MDTREKDQLDAAKRAAAQAAVLVAQLRDALPTRFATTAVCNELNDVIATVEAYSTDYAYEELDEADE